MPTLVLISYLEEWLAVDAVLNVTNKPLHAQSYCPLAISSVDEPECNLVSGSTTWTAEFINKVNSINFQIIFLTAVGALISVGTIIMITIAVLKFVGLNRRCTQKKISSVR